MPTTIMSQLLNALIIDLITVKVFIWVVMILFTLEFLALVWALVVNDYREDRLRYACHLIPRAGLAVVAGLILYSDCLEVYPL